MKKRDQNKQDERSSKEKKGKKTVANIAEDGYHQKCLSGFHLPVITPF